MFSEFGYIDVTLPFKSGSRDGSYPNAETIIQLNSFPVAAYDPPERMQTVAGCHVKTPMKSPISGGCPITIRKNIRNSSNRRSLLHIYIVHPYPYACIILIVELPCLILDCNWYKIPHTPNFTIFKAPSLGKTMPGLLDGFLHHFQVLSGCGPLRQEGQPLLHLQRRPSGLQGDSLLLPRVFDDEMLTQFLGVKQCQAWLQILRTLQFLWMMFIDV